MAPSAPTYTASSGVAQKGPLILGSTVTAQELAANLSPTGKQYSYQVTSNLGTFSPTSKFGSQYIGLDATGYYFDEVANTVSSGTVTLNGYSDLVVDSVLNVNLLTTLAYQRIQNLVTKSNLTFAAARTQAESEVLKALNIPAGSYGSFGSFGTLDLSRNTDGDHILAAISSIFVYGNSPGPLSQLIANFQSDIGTNGVITNDKTTAALVAAAEAVDPTSVAAHLTQEYASEGLTFTARNISEWIAQSGDGVIGKFAFQYPDSTPSTIFTFPASIVSQFAGATVSVTAGQLSVNGVPVSTPVSIKAGDIVTLVPNIGNFPNGVLTAYLISGAINLAKVSFVKGLVSIAVTPTSPSVAAGLTQQFTAIGTYSDNSTADFTSSVGWSSGNSTVATINSKSGVAKSLTVGASVITATSGSVSGSATLNVTPPILRSVAITPNPVNYGNGNIGIVATIGSNVQLTATGTYSDGTSQNVSTIANWTSDVPSVASVGLTTGLTNAVSTGFCTISATIGSITATAPLWIVTNVLSLATYTSILAVSNTSVLYTAADGSIHFHSGLTDTALSTASIPNSQDLSNWKVTDDGYVFASFNNVYMWPQGSVTPTNLGTGNLISEAPSVHFPWVLWINGSYTQYTLDNVTSNQQLAFSPDQAAGGNDDCDFATINGQLAVFYWSTSQFGDPQGILNIYRWDQATNVSTQLSNDGLSLYPQTDGTWVAWQTLHGQPPQNPPYTLSLLNIASNTSTVLSTSMARFQLSTGLVGWLDETVTTTNGVPTVTSQTIRVSDGISTTTISTLLGANFIGSSGGYAVYQENSNVYAWSVAGGRQLLFGGSALSAVFLGGKVVYFSFPVAFANPQTIFAVTLP